ncbi:MAG TPA: hypothetical protein VIA18_21065 [Polyangia bacterium]|jgi:hypothetical protein|nr:hypothetical protein [Polyangia bacterium]
MTAASGCHISLDNGTATSSCKDASFALPSDLGQLGKVRFAYDSAVSTSPSTPIAVGGSVFIVLSAADPSQPVPAGTLTTDSPIATVEGAPNGLGQLTGVQAGAGTLTLSDSNGHVIDRIAYSVADVDGVAFADGWGSAAGPTVLVGATERYRIRLLDGATELIGYGLTQFTYGGPMQHGSESNAPVEFLPDTEENFAVGTAAGAATLTAQSGAATVTLPVTIVDASAITSGTVTITPPASGCASEGVHVRVTALAGDTAVYGPSCDWSTSADDVPERFDDTGQWSDTGGWTGDDAARRYLIAPAKPGQYHLTCKLTDTVSVPVDISYPQ